MFMTPVRGVKRRLFATPASAKRARVGRGRVSGGAAARRINRRTQRGPRTKGSIVQQVKSLQRVVKTLSPEVKYVDIDIAATNITSGGTAVNLTQIAQGDTQSTRTGNSVNITSITLLARWTRATDVTTPDNGLYRFAVVVDREQVADTAPTPGTVFSGSPIFFLPSLANLERFRILYLSPIIDGKMMLTDSDDTTVPTRPAIMQYNWTGNIKVGYNDTAATDIEKNGIYIMYITNEATDVIDVAGTARIGYTDI